MSTGAILIVSLLVVAALWIGLEVVRLKDQIPNNHITPVVRAAFHAQPGVFLAFFCLLAYLCGHLFWP